MDSPEGSKVIRQGWLQTSAPSHSVFAGLSLSQRGSWTIFGLLLLSVGVVGVICLKNALTWVDKPFAGFLLNERMAVSNVGRYHWSGTQAGLKYPDKILTADGVLVSSIADLEEVIEPVSIGTPVRYAVAKGSEIVAVTIPTMRFGWGDLFLTFGIIFLSGLVYLTLGAIIFILKPNVQVSWLFFLSCFLVAVYTITAFDIQSTHWGFMRLYQLVFAFIPATFVHLGVVFPEKKKLIERHPVLQGLPYLCSAVLLIPLETLYPQPSFLPFYRALKVYLIVSALIVVGATLHAYITTSSVVTKQRARVIFLGTGLAFPLPVVALYLSFSWGAVLGVTIQQNFLVLPSLIFPASIAYAIVKHNLFDIDVFVRRTCGYVLSTAAVVGVYALLLSVLNLGFRSAEVSASPAFSLVFTLGAVFVFGPLHRRVQSLVDRAFYRQQYDYRRTIRDVSEAMTSILDADLIHQTLVRSVTKEMFLENGLLLLPDAARRVYQAQTVAGIDGQVPRTLQVADTDVAFRILQERNDALLRHDLDLRPSYAPYREALQHTLDTLSSELLLPMKYKGEMRGIIALGRKKSGQIFTLEDLDLLKTLTNQAAVAMENARLFKESLDKSRLEEELKLAHDIQVSMLPKRAPQIAGVTIAAKSLPAREVGGDFYDFIEMDGEGSGGRCGIVIGDVSGKAISGALVMAAARTMLRVLAEAGSSIEEVLGIGNQRLRRDIQKGMFVALLYAVVDPQRRLLAFANAGLTLPVLCPGDGGLPSYLTTDGHRLPLGIVKEVAYQATWRTLAPGDTVVFYTDGVVEAMNANGELYGFERFMAAVEEGRDLAPEALIEWLRADVGRHVGNAEQHDDLTLVVLKADGRGAGRPGSAQNAKEG